MGSSQPRPPPGPPTPSGPRRPSNHAAGGPADEHDETDVPREARLQYDAHGELVFIGDCAPLSFFQTVRQLVTSTVDPAAFAPQTSRYSMLQNANSRRPILSGPGRCVPDVRPARIGRAVLTYFAVTAGLADLFADNATLPGDISLWAAQGQPAEDATSAIHYLVLAIGSHIDDEQAAELYFDRGRDLALAHLSGSLGVGTVQAFILITLYMLVACQINGAFLYFGIAARAAYSIGLHRTEVNSRFGPAVHRHRDRLWKSLRIVDLFLSTSMGRPPATSDLDCTVAYKALDEDGSEAFDMLNASVQIFLIIELVVLEIYSRRKISLQLTEGISRQLRDWSERWLRPLKEMEALPPHDGHIPQTHGACQVLASYYYGVVLASRPFLMYELRRRLSAEESSDAADRPVMLSGKSKLADACINAASLMVETAMSLINGAVAGRLPVLVYTSREPPFELAITNSYT